MDDCIRVGVSSAEEKLPGRLGLRRRAPMLYRRLMRGYYKSWYQLVRCQFADWFIWNSVASIPDWPHHTGLLLELAKTQVQEQ